MAIIGFHGTDANNEKSILEHNFSVSAKDDDWLGTGAYFFIEGISDPIVDARNWAKLQSYDTEMGKNSYSRYVVIKATIEVTNVLRLDERDGQIAYNYFRNYLIGKMKKERVPPKVGAIRNDCEVCNHILENTEFEAIINPEYIKLDKWSRVKRYASRIPTCRIISVKEPKAAIDVCDLQVVERGKV
ncbi:hypothetical protein GKQ23_13580 [Erwinia sp. E602]|uniref:hypothetical protein n=1 Tax=Erwinia sp. E602 TaxID=2675378 RepID=UPI001BAC1D53|nr:hypothetical protein [Erwinia sp. E602]QUG75962.1 hypothetical protein GKQ23_13580 [Erwinia sp. E602]